MGNYRIYVGESRRKEIDGWGQHIFFADEENKQLNDNFKKNGNGICRLFGPQSLQVMPEELSIGCDFGIVDSEGHGPFGEYSLRRKFVTTPEAVEVLMKKLSESKKIYADNLSSIQEKYSPQIGDLQSKLGLVERKMENEILSLGPKPDLKQIVIESLGLNRSDD